MAKIYDEVLNNANIRDVLSAYGLQIVGNKCICPFHDDRNPSMVINDKKQYVKCFACGAGANVITFVYKYEREINHNDISISEAIRKVVDICNLDIDLSSLEMQSNDQQYENNGYRYNERDKELLETANFIKNLSSYNLKTSSNDSDVKRYLTSRGFSEELADYEGFGFLSKGQLLSLLGKRKELSEDRLVELGLLQYGTDGNLYEVFSDRVLIPIHDEKGNVVSFSGRALHGEEPKYLHGKNSSVFHRSDILYNYNKAKNYAYRDEMYVVEGFMDVAGGNRMGIHNIVATMGTGLSDKQLDLIKKSKSIINLMRDNDTAGKNAMLKEIPELLKQGLSVNVIDLSEYPNDCKDLWDISNTGENLIDLEKHKVNGFSYLMKYKYFLNQEISSQNILEAYKKASEDGILTTSLHENMFLDYIESVSSLQRINIEDIIHPKPIEDKDDPRTRLRNRIERDFVLKSIDEYLATKNNRIMKAYYEEHKTEMSNKILKSYFQSPQVFLYKEDVNVALLLYEQLHDDKEFEKYDYIHRFQHEHVFNNTFIKNVNGEARLQLTQEQQSKVIDQYHAMDNQDKMALESVEDLYIVNSVEDLDGILNLGNNKEMEMLKDRIKFQMSIYPEKMMYFKYGNVFREEDKYAISDNYKDSSGEYKTLLLYNNFDNKLDLKKSHVVKEEMNKEVIEKSKLINELHKEISQEKAKEGLQEYVTDEVEVKPDTFRFSIHKSIIKGEDDKNYFVRIPRTKMKSYTYFPKNQCKWVESGEMMYTRIKSDQMYKVYDEAGNEQKEWSYDEMKRKWEDKTKIEKENKKEKVLDIVSKLDEKSKIETQEKGNISIASKPFSNDVKSTASTKKDEQVTKLNGDYIISKSKIVRETPKGYYISLADKKKVLYIAKEIVELNKYNTHLLIDPRKSMFKKSGISLYEKNDDGKLQFKEHIKTKHIGNYLGKRKINKSNDMKYIGLFHELEHSPDGIYLRVPGAYNGYVGNININAYYFSKINGHIELNVPKEAEFSFYSNNGIYAGSVKAEEILSVYEEGKTNTEVSSDYDKNMDEQEITL